MTNEEVVKFLNGQWPPSVDTLKGIATGFDRDEMRLKMDFETDLRFCHSGDVVQGGYISGMLDAVMAYAAIGMPGLCNMVATLEIKVSYMQTARNGEFTGSGRVIHAGRSIAYLDGELYQSGKLVAAATSTVKLMRAK
ncbi:MAG: acyl-CoA thioesterase [Parasphingorhabdus sp.]|jgi:acyl-CoA thioesterase